MLLTEILSSAANEFVGSLAGIVQSFAGSVTDTTNGLTSAFTETGEGALDISALSSTPSVFASLFQVSHSAGCRVTHIAARLGSSVGRTFACISGGLRGALGGVIGEFAQLLGLASRCRVEFAW